MKQTILSLMAAGLCIASLGLAGCDTAPRVYLSDDNQMLPPTSGKLTAGHPTPIPDVPIPEGFVVVQKKSRSVLANNVRFVEHYYQGRASKADTVDFYRRALPGEGWREESYQFDGSSYVLHHSKNRELLDMRISESRDVTSAWIQIRDRSLPVPPPTAAPGASPGVSPGAAPAPAPGSTSGNPAAGSSSSNSTAKPIPTSANPAPARPAAP